MDATIQPDWQDRPAAVGEERVDAVLSTTALHWLPAADLLALYHRLAVILRPGGLLLNGDHLAFGATLGTFDQITQAVAGRREREVFGDGRGEDWRRWWEALRAEKGLAERFAERERRFAWRGHDEPKLSLALHSAMLHQAGFGEVATIWQRLAHRVLLAIR